MVFRLNNAGTRTKLVYGGFSVQQLRSTLEGFSKFAFFHGSRVEDPETFFREGLKVSDSDALDRLARSIFVKPKFPHVTDDQFTAAVAKIGRGDHGNISLVLDERELTDCLAAHLVYGSERVTRLGQLLGVSAALTKRGVPMLVETHLPRRLLPDGTLDSLAARRTRFRR